jgi:6,7-dimethyl-8-ribityllumazine synthase
VLTNTSLVSVKQNHNRMASKGNAQLVKIDAGAREFSGACIVIVKTEWNASIVDELEKGAIRILKKHGIKDIRTVIVPGAVEITFAVRTYWETTKYKDVKPDAFITLGCVVRGDTPHFDYVCSSVNNGVMQLNLKLPVPVIFGVLTVNDNKQAEERIGGKHGHKGEEAGLTALKMIRLVKQIKAER